MNAVVKAPPMPVRDEIYNQVKYGRYPLNSLLLDGPECVRWMEEEATGWKPEISIACKFLDVAEALWDDEKKRAKLNRLMRAMLDDSMRIDDLIDLRDMIRSEYIDHCSEWARRELELQLDTE